jgi:Lrp/AsnC family transcriptional regulator of lysine biosynthesis
MSINKIDEKILEILRENARTPYVEIARKVGLSEGGVRKRIEKLIEHGIIKKFTIEVEIEKVRYVSALVLIKVDPAIPTANIVKEIARLKTAYRICEITGPYDIALFLEESSMEALNEGIEQIRSIRGVLDTSSFIVLRRHSF